MADMKDVIEQVARGIAASEGRPWMGLTEHKKEILKTRARATVLATLRGTMDADLLQRVASCTEADALVACLILNEVIREVEDGQ